MDFRRRTPGGPLPQRGSTHPRNTAQPRPGAERVLCRAQPAGPGEAGGGRPSTATRAPISCARILQLRAEVLHLRTIQAAGWAYTVPSRPFRKEVAVRPYADEVDVYHKDALVERMERAHEDLEARVDYHHIIGSLARKPGPFARYRFREQRFPTMAFRVSYDVPRQWRGERADVEYVGTLHRAAKGSGSPAPSRPGRATSSEWSGHGSPR